MNLDTLGNLGEFLGGVGVVISLVYVALQVRQNTESLRTENYARALDRVAAMQSELSRNGELAQLFSRGVSDLSNLPLQQRIQVTWSLYELFGALEFMYHASRSRALPDEVWNRWAAALAWWLTFPGVQRWWRARPTPFTPSFTAFVDATLENNPSDPQAHQRWREFILAGDSTAAGEATAG